MVLATAVPRKNAATKLKNAAHTTASFGDKTRHGRNAVGGVVKSVQKIEGQGDEDRDDQQ